MLYNKFSDRAMDVMKFARQEADRLNHDWIGTEHVLLGLTMEKSGMSATIFEKLKIDPEKIRSEIEHLSRPGAGAPVAQPPLTPRVESVIESAKEASRAQNMDQYYVGTEHILIGLLREQDGLAAQVLMRMGLRLEDVLRELKEFYGETPEEKVQDKTGDAVDAPRKYTKDHEILMKVASLAMNAADKDMPGYSRCKDIWKAFHLGLEYAGACAKQTTTSWEISWNRPDEPDHWYFVGSSKVSLEDATAQMREFIGWRRGGTWRITEKAEIVTERNVVTFHSGDANGNSQKE